MKTEKKVPTESMTILAYGIARDILGGREYQLPLKFPATVGRIQEALLTRFPAFQGLSSIRIAVNASYASLDQKVYQGDEVVVIPPVSGG